SGVTQSRRVVDEQLGGFELGGHVGELELDRLELRERPTELLALLGVVEGQFEDRSGERDRQRRDRDPADRERGQELREAAGRVADDVLVGQVDIGEGQLPAVEGVPTDAAKLGAGGVAGRVLLYEEGPEALR